MSESLRAMDFKEKTTTKGTTLDSRGRRGASVQHEMKMTFSLRLFESSHDFASD